MELRQRRSNSVASQPVIDMIAVAARDHQSRDQINESILAALQNKATDRPTLAAEIRSTGFVTLDPITVPFEQLPGVVELAHSSPTDFSLWKSISEFALAPLLAATEDAAELTVIMDIHCIQKLY